MTLIYYETIDTLYIIMFHFERPLKFYMYCSFMSILRMNKIKLNLLECGEHMSLQFLWHLHIFTVMGYRLACLDFLHHLRTQIPAAVLALMHCSFMRCLDETTSLEYVDPGIRGWKVIPSMKSKKANGLPVALCLRKNITAIQTGWWAFSAAVSC